MRQTELTLSQKDRQRLRAFCSKGTPQCPGSQSCLRAALDRTMPESQIRDVLGVGRTVIWRTRAALSEGGLAFALHDVPRPGKPKRYHTDEEAQMAALAGSAPPAGAMRWTVAL